MKFAHIFSTIKIHGMELRNRLLVPAMGSHLIGSDGYATDAFVEYWAARARGGWGLLILEVAAVDPLGDAGKSPALWDDSFIAGLQRVTDIAHQNGTKIAIQLQHAGRQTMRAVIGTQPVAPSPIPCPVIKEMPRALSTEEVWDLVEKFGDAALRARKAGFDAIEIHGGHGYLVAEFMSAYSNKRTDIFGGSLSNRMRFPVEIIKNIRLKAGNDYPILFRLSWDEMVPGGRTLFESKAVARILEDAGADALDISSGVYGSMYYHLQGPAALPPGYNLAATAEIKKSVSIPVIAVGALHDPHMAEDALATGIADLIGWGRQSLADPEAPNKLAGGRMEEIRPCIRCNQGCSGRVLKGRHVTCILNPFTGREAEWKLEPASTKKNLVVVGGGPAGLEAAWLSAWRGHKVTVMEKGDSLGGQLNIAAVPPVKQDLARMTAYLIHMCEKHGVIFKTKTEATVKNILAQKPDAVVLATGAVPLTPKLKGSDGPGIVQAWDVLAGKTEVGNKVLIVGGGMIGAETADFLAEHGHRVTIVEMLSEIAMDAEPSPRHFLLERLKSYGVKMKTRMTVEAFMEKGVRAIKDGQEMELTGFDTIVLAMGATSENVLKAELEKSVPEFYVIGDAVEPRKALEAIEEGAAVALQL